MIGAIIANTALGVWYTIFYLINRGEYEHHLGDVVCAFVIHSAFIWVAALWR